MLCHVSTDEPSCNTQLGAVALSLSITEKSQKTLWVKLFLVGLDRPAVHCSRAVTSARWVDFGGGRFMMMALHLSKGERVKGERRARQGDT